jgi:hypothetical protein
VLCAALYWSGEALRLKDRDEWIDWDSLTRASRLPLVTQLRRLLVVDARREPNLATRCLGLALRELPGHFEDKHGYRPVRAESFSDPSLHEGTTYQASNRPPPRIQQRLQTPQERIPHRRARPQDIPGLSAREKRPTTPLQPHALATLWQLKLKLEAEMNE